MSTDPSGQVLPLSRGSWAEVLARHGQGHRFAGLLAAAVPGGTRLTVVLALADRLQGYDRLVPDELARVDSLTAHLPAAAWYERAMTDLHGLRVDGQPSPRPLVLPLPGQVSPPRPGGPAPSPALEPDEHVIGLHVDGPGMFTIPHGPVRSGVTESVEYLLETPGEDISHLHVRVFAKHRGIQSRFSGLGLPDATLLAERVEGVASVAHATAFAQAVESALGVQAPVCAGLSRVLHAELERIANHVDVALRLSEAAGLSVAVSRLGWHKERVLRLVSQLCGNRFGRGVVIPGGVSRLPGLAGEQVVAALTGIADALLADADALMRTPSFLDRLRGTGPLDHGLAARHGALGPIGRGSGFDDDDRRLRPYAGYAQLCPEPVLGQAGDAQARLAVRLGEVRESVRLARAAALALEEHRGEPTSVKLPAEDGRGLGWAEAPHGEVLYDVELRAGTVLRAAPRSASLHNLPLFATTFQGDIFTDFPFVEASFGLPIAGVVL